MKYFDRLGSYASISNNTVYPEPKTIAVQFTHRDVVLDFFKNKKTTISKLRAGDSLEFDGTYFTHKGKFLAKISTKKKGEIEELEAKGYIPTVAKIRFIVAWKGEEDETECAVMLPDMEFRKVEQVEQKEEGD